MQVRQVYGEKESGRATEKQRKRKKKEEKDYLNIGDEVASLSQGNFLI